MVTLRTMAVVDDIVVPAFAARGLTKTYYMDGGGADAVAVHALRGVDLDVAAGELAVLVGPSGSGKSTLLNILGGLDQATTGELRFRGHDLSHASEGELTLFRRRHIGFVFQAYNLIPSLTARENVQLITDIATDPMSADESLALVGLADRADHFPSQMSGGEQQRVAIARAIAKRPDVLLCDEPTGALDSKTGILVLDAIDRVNRDLGTTTLLITHNRAIAAMADRVIAFADGRIAEITENAERLPPAGFKW